MSSRAQARRCIACGSWGTDVRQCWYCQELAPWGQVRDDNADGRLFLGFLALLGILIAVLGGCYLVTMLVVNLLTPVVGP